MTQGLEANGKYRALKTMLKNLVFIPKNNELLKLLEGLFFFLIFVHIIHSMVKEKIKLTFKYLIFFWNLDWSFLPLIISGRSQHPFKARHEAGNCYYPGIQRKDQVLSGARLLLLGLSEVNFVSLVWGSLPPMT